MGEDRVGHGGVGEPAQHGDLDRGHDLAPLGTENRGAQDLPAVRVDDGLHEAAGLPGLDGPDDGAHREPRHPDRVSSRPGFALGQADAAELRVDEHRVRDDPVPRARLLVPEEVRAQDAVVVVGQVGEGRPALDVSHRVDAGHAGFQVLVGLDEAPVVEANPGRLGGERLRIRNAADGRQQVRAFELPLAVLRAHGQPQAAAVCPL
ncbi:MAG TPA: hypothetical protein VGG75_21665, partial [Trebonia sp.]